MLRMSKSNKKIKEFRVFNKQEKKSRKVILQVSKTVEETCMWSIRFRQTKIYKLQWYECMGCKVMETKSDAPGEVRSKEGLTGLHVKACDIVEVVIVELSSKDVQSCSNDTGSMRMTGCRQESKNSGFIPLFANRVADIEGIAAFVLYILAAKI
jgi:hypothetical protein